MDADDHLAAPRRATASCLIGVYAMTTTPINAAAQAMDAAMQGHFPPTRPLLVMAAYAVVFGVVAIRLFRWEVKRHPATSGHLRGLTVWAASSAAAARWPRRWRWRSQVPWQ